MWGPLLSTLSPTASSKNSNRDLWGALGAKLISLPVTALLGLVALRLVSEEYSERGLAIYGLIVVIPLIIPFADLGLGGSVVEVVAARGNRTEEFVRSCIKRAAIVLLVVAFAIVTVAVVAMLFGGWSVVLGVGGSDTNWAFGLALTLYGLCVPFVLGYRLLTGLGLNAVSTILQSVGGAAGYIWIIIMSLRQSALWIVIVGPQICALIAAIVSCIVGFQKFNQEKIFGTQGGHEFSLFRVARANLVIIIAIPIAYQGGRLILSHSSSIDELAKYTAVFALYAPFAAFVSSGGNSLWARLSGVATDRSEFLRVLRTSVLLFSAIGFVGFCCLWLGGPFISRFVFSDLDIPVLLFLAFGALAFCFAVQYPFGMALMGPGGVQFQALCFLLMAPMSFAVCWLTSGPLGASSAVIGPLVGLLVCVLLPCCVRVFWLRRW